LPEPLDDGSLRNLIQHATRLIEGRVLKTRRHRVLDELGTAELAPMEVSIPDVLRPEPLLLEQVSGRLSQQRLHHMVDVVVPELRVRRLENLARCDHPSEPGSLIIVAEGESQLPHAAHLQELPPSIGRQSRKGLPQVNNVRGQMYFTLSPVDAPHRKVWAVNCLERNRLNLACCRHLPLPH